MKKIKVLVVDDSPLFRKFVTDELSKVDFIDVVGSAVDPIDALSKINVLKPDVISCDIEMPKMDGITFVKKLMSSTPIRVVIASSLNVSVFDVMSAGAIDFVRKPAGMGSDEKEQFVKELSEKIFIAAQAKLKIINRSAAAKPATDKPKPAQANHISTQKKPGTPAIFAGKTRFSLAAASTLIALGASTGGTEALLEVVKDFPADTPGVVIVQHMPPGFTKMYADRLSRICKMKVKEAQTGDKIRQGQILIAPGDLQMTVVKNMGELSVRCVSGDKVSGHRPSVDVLFSSVAKVACPNSIGVILTGMGSDGAKGLLEMKQNGAYTIGQDEESCVVYGMPMVAYKIGAVQTQAPLNKISEMILGYLSRK